MKAVVIPVFGGRSVLVTVPDRLGLPVVTSRPATDQNIPACNFHVEDGGLSVGVMFGAAKALGGISLLAWCRALPRAARRSRV